jgi:hypothetical protein
VSQWPPFAGVGTIVEFEPNRFAVTYGANAVSTLLGLVYFIGFWSLRGQTPGDDAVQHEGRSAR